MIILTDSAADMTVEEISAYGIHIAPLTINLPEGETTSEQITPDGFYNRLREMAPDIPTTSQPSTGTFSRTYQQLSEAKEEILSIHISSGLSGTLESARLAARQLGHLQITPVDTLTLSGGQRYQVLAAALAARATWSREAILERLDLIRAETEVIFTLETLEYLRRGGRIGRVQALAGSLLNIKPVIRVDKTDGKYSTAGRGRTMRQAMEKITDHLERTYSRSKPVWVTIMHGQSPEAAEALTGMLQERLHINRLDTLRVSPVLGVHTGPGVVGAAVVPASLLEGLDTGG